jgi:integrase
MTRRSPGEGALFQQTRKNLWVGVVEIPSTDGKRRQQRVTAKTKSACAAKLRKLRTDVANGNIAVTSKTTVAAWLDRWLKDIHGPRLRPGTRDDYARTIRLHIKPNLGSRRLDKLTPQHVRDMCNAVAVETERTAQLAHVIINKALKDAIAEGLLTRNVAAVADRPRHVTKRRKPLTADEAKQLLRSAIAQDDPWATRWAAALLLGARQGEVLGLQWERSDTTEIGLDLDTGIAAYEWQLQQLKQSHGCGKSDDDETWPCGRKKPGYCPQRQWEFERGFEYQVLSQSLILTRPKTQAGVRVVPIPAPLWAMLATHPRGDINPHSLVWHHADGRPLSPREDYDNWQAALKTAGLAPAPLHAARNTTATLLLEAGVPEDIRMAILGHVSVTAHRAYAHINQAPKREAMAALDQLLT